MSAETKYDHKKIEDKWYTYWINNNYFSSKPDDREPYTIVIPPPNITGVLHMGHMLNNTIQDILVRRARLLGKNACWVPGTDHASIATEAKVVEKLKSNGIEIAGIEYIKGKDGQHYTYDINTNTNYNSVAERKSDLKGMDSIATFLYSELIK